MGYIGLVFMIIAYALVKPAKNLFALCIGGSANLPIVTTCSLRVYRFLQSRGMFRVRGWTQQSTNKVIKAHYSTHAHIHSLHHSIKDHLKASETISRVTTYHRLTHTQPPVTCVGCKRLTMALIRKSNKTL